MRKVVLAELLIRDGMAADADYVIVSCKEISQCYGHNVNIAYCDDDPKEQQCRVRYVSHLLISFHF